MQGRLARREHRELQGRLEAMAQMVAQEFLELLELLACKVIAPSESLSWHSWALSSIHEMKAPDSEF